MRNFLIFAFLGGFISCASQHGEISKKIYEPLTGTVTRDLLFSEYPTWQDEGDTYAADSLICDSLGTNRDIDIEIFFGTWCSDSKREVPRFFKILDQAQFIQPERIKLWAVDRSKKLPDGLTEKRNIEYVATFIFFQNGMEIGRIVEQPESSLEADILRIIKPVKL